MRFLYTILVNALALFVVSLVLDNFSFEGGWLAPIVVSLVFTILNYLVKPILKFLSFPLIVLSAGLFVIVINGVILYLSEYLIRIMDIEGVAFHINGLLTYAIAAIIFGLANWLIHWFLKE